MNNMISTVLYAFILVSSLIYIWHKLLDKKIDFKNPKLYLTLIGIMLFSLLNNYMTDKITKIVVVTIIFMFFFKFLFNENVQKCILTPIFYQFIIMISETIYALLLTLILSSNADALLQTYLGTFMTNVSIAIISLLIVNINFIRKLYKLVIIFTDKIKKFQLLSRCIIVIIALSVFPITIYYKIDFKYLLIFYSSMIIVCCAIIIYSFKTQNKYNKVSDKYNVAINSLKDYEEMMSQYRVTNHENKNLLLTIRAMIINQQENIPQYIESIIKEKYNDNEKLLKKVNVIPSGGLRATIYSEILKIKENGINYCLDIDRNLKTEALIDLDTNSVIDICKILGVFIDNAIEEVKNSNKRNIKISIYMDNNDINIKVSNNYINYIDVDKIFNEGYTTKGSGHGYGLSLVKRIIEKNSILSNSSEITKNLFSQVLTIKYKKSKK